jgi:hypothetical protein
LYRKIAQKTRFFEKKMKKIKKKFFFAITPLLRRSIRPGIESQPSPAREPPGRKEDFRL